jgi:capsular polysaccharide biosynthesis protein
LNDREDTTSQSTDLSLGRGSAEVGPDEPTLGKLQQASVSMGEADSEMDGLDADWAIDRRPDASVGLAGLGFIKAALGRRARVWVVLGLVGLLAGTLFLVARPPAHEATVTLLLAGPPTAVEGVTIADDQAQVQSVAVAGQALRELKLTESPTTFLHHYSAAVVTNSVLQITAKAASSADAISQANALAAAFLSFQASVLTGQDQAVTASDNLQIALAQQHVNSLSTQIGNLSALPATPARTAQLGKLQNEHVQAANTLAIVSGTLPTDAADSEATNEGVIAGSKVLNSAVPVAWSPAKWVALYAGGGLLGGLALGMAIVIISALVSDRLRRRDDIARVLGAPVRLSTGQIPVRRPELGRLAGHGHVQHVLEYLRVIGVRCAARLRSSQVGWLRNVPDAFQRIVDAAFQRAPEDAHGLNLAGNADVQHVVDYLRATVPHSSGLPAGMAVVPVDDMEIPAVCLTLLAHRCAQAGLRVVLADLCPGSPAARLLEVTEPGVRTASAQGAEIIVAVPDAGDIRPAGPLTDPADDRVPKSLSVACSAADVLLTLAHLDPAVGGVHLSGWATSVVAIVTAGRSSAGRISAVGEMIHQSGIHEVSAVLLGSDKYDESFGGVRPSMRALHEVRPLF